VTQETTLADIKFHMVSKIIEIGNKVIPED
jgi:hypothetical protein